MPIAATARPLRRPRGPCRGGSRGARLRRDAELAERLRAHRRGLLGARRDDADGPHQRRERPHHRDPGHGPGPGPRHPADGRLAVERRSRPRLLRPPRSLDRAQGRAAPVRQRARPAARGDGVGAVGRAAEAARIPGAAARRRVRPGRDLVAADVLLVRAGDGRRGLRRAHLRPRRPGPLGERRAAGAGPARRPALGAALLPVAGQPAAPAARPRPHRHRRPLARRVRRAGGRQLRRRRQGDLGHVGHAGELRRPRPAPGARAPTTSPSSSRRPRARTATTTASSPPSTSTRRAGSTSRRS